MESDGLTLAQLGWTPFFREQILPEELERNRPVRVMAVHRGMVMVAGEGFEKMISSQIAEPVGPEDRPTVSDWLLIDRKSDGIVRILDRSNLFKRPAPGDDRRVQLIAANVDTLFVVTSCDQDFNIARLERYLVLAREVGVLPVVVLTKLDLAENPDRFVAAARSLQPGLEVEIVNGRDSGSVAHLAARCGRGGTVALVGSSGVGKSTLINTLRGSDSIATQAVRETDGKGRHTTTVRQMHRLTSGKEEGGGYGWLVDTPGMREFQLSDATTGLAEVFDDLAALELECRFTNCTHVAEPGCAIQPALADGTVSQGRYDRWRKLTAEDTANTDALTARKMPSRKPGKKN